MSPLISDAETQDRGTHLTSIFTPSFPLVRLDSEIPSFSSCNTFFSPLYSNSPLAPHLVLFYNLPITKDVGQAIKENEENQIKSNNNNHNHNHLCCTLPPPLCMSVSRCEQQVRPVLFDLPTPVPTLSGISSMLSIYLFNEPYTFHHYLGGKY